MTQERPLGSFVIGTAGHIDHGKSTLVEALTGIDPDRLEEEKRRGMTIDLGFAYVDLPSGRHVGIIDVPGHQRFVRNMLAGVHGIDAVLFVIAADEGPMPQSREHLAIIDLLAIDRGVVALTKSDAVDAEWLALMGDDVARLLQGTGLRRAPIVPVSGVTGAGLDQLVERLDTALAGAMPRPDTGRPRLAVDRAFAMSGFGTVVTGTLIGGALRVGDGLILQPSGRPVRVRGLQQHNLSVEVAQPGSRTAVNLTGVERREVSRGDVLAPAGQLVPTRRLDARLRVLGDVSHGIRHRAGLVLYHGTAEIPVEVILLDTDELSPGSSGWAQLYCARPLVATAGDRFILRQPAPAVTLAGGLIVDLGPRRHRRRDPALLRDLDARDQRDLGVTVAVELAQHPLGLQLQALSRRLGMDDKALHPVVEQLEAAGAAIRLGDTLVAAQPWARLRGRVIEALDAHHAAHPLRPGMPREELKSRLRIPPALYPQVLARLLIEGLVVERGAELARPGHQPRVSGEQDSLLRTAVAELEAAGLAPPPAADWMTRHGLTPALVQFLIAQDRVVRVSDDTIFARTAYDAALARLRAHLEAHERITVAQARDLLSSSRRYVLPLLEWLDAQKVTRRVGDDRILRR